MFCRRFVDVHVSIFVGIFVGVLLVFLTGNSLLNISYKK